MKTLFLLLLVICALGIFGCTTTTTTTRRWVPAADAAVATPTPQPAPTATPVPPPSPESISTVGFEKIWEQDFEDEHIPSPGYGEPYKAIAPFAGGMVEWGSIHHFDSSLRQSALGAKSIDLNGVAGPGAWAWEFPTIPGEPFSVSYRLAGNTANGPLEKRGRVEIIQIDSEKVEPFSFDIRGKSLFNMGWVERELPFIARGERTIVRFVSDTPGLFGPSIDSVQVKGPKHVAEELRGKYAPIETPVATPVPGVAPDATPMPTPTAIPTPTLIPTPTPQPVAPGTQGIMLYRNNSKRVSGNLPPKPHTDEQVKVCHQFEENGVAVNKTHGLGDRVVRGGQMFPDCTYFAFDGGEAFESEFFASFDAHDKCFDAVSRNVYRRRQATGEEEWMGKQVLVSGNCDNETGFEVANPYTLFGNPVYRPEEGTITVTLIKAVDDNQSYTVFSSLVCPFGYTAAYRTREEGEFITDVGSSFETDASSLELEAKLTGLSTPSNIRQCALSLK